VHYNHNVLKQTLGILCDLMQRRVIQKFQRRCVELRYKKSTAWQYWNLIISVWSSRWRILNIGGQVSAVQKLH